MMIVLELPEEFCCACGRLPTLVAWGGKVEVKCSDCSRKVEAEGTIAALKLWEEKYMEAQ